MITTDLKHWIQEAAKRHGFELCGIAPAALDPENREHYLRWLDQGFQGEMEYMKRYERQDLRSLLPTVRSVISLGMIYNTPLPLSIECDDPTRGWIARYAWGDDYHEVMKERMQALLAELRAEVGKPFDTRIYVDTGPVLERAVAWAAGLGWIAKNTCLINEQAGSWFFLGEILTSLDLAPNLPAPDRCGSCTRCLDACPTGAITEPYVLDATRCISYYTIEVKGTIPESMRPQIGHHIFGCDICQDVCPWNRSAPVTAVPQFHARPLNSSRDREGATAKVSDGWQVTSDKPTPDETALNPELQCLGKLTGEQFQATFRTSPVRRARYRGFLRNVCIAMGNSHDEKFHPVLKRLASHEDPLIQEHAAWALAQLPTDSPAK